jgi:two-component system nitrate/nitrite response regulator NarL
MGPVALKIPFEEPVMIQVAVVDDHPVARCGIAAMLDDAVDIAVTATVASTEGLAAGRGSEVADVVLLDLYQRSDVPCLADIVRLRASTRVLVMSASGRPSDVLGAIKAGAAGYLTKLADTAALVSAIRTVAGGGFALSPKLADIVQAELISGREPVADGSGGRDPGQAAAHLSAREEQALGLIAQGFTHSQAARRMGVTKATVDTYVERIRAKLQLGNKAELTRAAMARKAGGDSW